MGGQIIGQKSNLDEEHLWTWTRPRLRDEAIRLMNEKGEVPMEDVIKSLESNWRQTAASDVSGRRLAEDTVEFHSSEVLLMFPFILLIYLLYRRYAARMHLKF